MMIKYDIISLSLPLLLSLFVTITTTVFGASITNPSGTCGVDNSEGAGDRPGYHSPSPGTTYVPNCNNSPKREYWRVFVGSGGDISSTYIIPRPDEKGVEYGFCGEGDDLSELFERNSLCETTDVEKINNIPLDEALRITNALHGKLVFVAESWSLGDRVEWSISPWAPEDDILEICDKEMTADANALGYCGRIRSRCDGVEIGIEPSEAAVKAVVPLLN
eukprot:CAMPEP_0202002176 /NCGR_PEP_ID=MMETSP0905-20130828/8078_1 /ASSEMBLY_ACC=CAM_ASM_000554 /TAXON_ID=420261 /ORGANISM="Thalassiosira antarctica, Strain CCMP982" /LENGTH=219 /DNA_ID=CAMNT_0048559005 /DNA_START=19 /DNA_END=675 /DNA_ORIENTATION=+